MQRPQNALGAEQRHLNAHHENNWSDLSRLLNSGVLIYTAIGSVLLNRAGLAENRMQVAHVVLISVARLHALGNR